jgi:small subunit ribosomal protein S6
MKTYELTFILNPNLDKELVNTEIDQITSLITSNNGTVLEVQHLGMRRMTYEMKGFWQGNYYTVYYQAEPDVLKQLEARMKLNESFLRFLTLVLKPSEYVPLDKRPSVTDEPDIPDENEDKDNEDEEEDV